jgi:hypothetical protein
VAACAYPRFIYSDIESDRIHSFIDQNYRKFAVSYSGDSGLPGAIRFDPKGDGVELTGKGWYSVHSREDLHRLASLMMDAYRFYGQDAMGPTLYLIKDSQDRSIGYYFSPLHYTPMSRDGNNYSMSPVTEVDVREKAQSGVRGAGA